VHLSIFISVINQLDAQNFCLIISLFHASTYFEHHVIIIRRSKLHYTASGIITPIGGRPVHRLRETATCRCDDTRRCIIQFRRPDDEHMCSKHVEAWNKPIVKQNFCASSWLITEINVNLYQTGREAASFIWRCGMVSLAPCFADVGPHLCLVRKCTVWVPVWFCYLVLVSYGKLLRNKQRLSSDL